MSDKNEEPHWSMMKSKETETIATESKDIITVEDINNENHREHSLSSTVDNIEHFIANLFYFPFKLLWNIFVIVGTIWLTILWIGFLFGSVVGVVIVLIFMPELFLLPIPLFAATVELWPENNHVYN